MAAVTNYLQTEEAFIQQTMMLQSTSPAPEPIVLQKSPTVNVATNLWGTNGRQSQMQMRNLMQLKAFQT